MTNEDATTTYERDGDVAVITLDDGKANALGHTTIDALRAALGRAASEARAVAVIGREGKFSAGFDLKVMQAGPAQARDLLAAGAELGVDMLTCPIPIVIGCTGHALAMGAILLFCGDLRIGAEGPYKIGMNEVAIGMPVPRFALTLARERLSTRHLTAATNLAHIYDPASAVDAGYLDRVVLLDQVGDSATVEAAALAASLNTNAFALTREYLRGPVAARVREALDADVKTFAIAE